MIGEMTVEEILIVWYDKNCCTLIRVLNNGDKFIAIDFDKNRTRSFGYDYTVDVENVLNNL